MNKITEIINNPVLLDVQAGLSAAKNEIMQQVKFGVNDIAIPIILTILAAVLIFAIAKAVERHRNGEDYKEHIKAIAIIVLIIALVASARSWIWIMVGV